MQGKVRMDAECGEKRRDKVAIKLDRVQPAAAFQQRTGKRSQAGANFHEVVPLRRGYCSFQAIDDSRIAEEVLSEALSGLVGASQF